MKVLACLEFDQATQACVQEVWIEPPGVLPPLPAEQGVVLSGYVLGIFGVAWGYRYLRRFLSPKTG